MHFSRATLLLFALGLQGLQSAEASWCHAPAGSCVGERRSFEKKRFPIRGLAQRRGSNKRLFHFADWHGDGDADILAGKYYPEDEGKEASTFRIHFHERLSNNTFRIQELLKTPVIRHTRQEVKLAHSFDFQVADWDGDKKLDLLLFTRVLSAPMNASSIAEVRVEDSWVTFLSHGLLPLNSLEKGTVILNGGEGDQPGRLEQRQCDMKPVDWDEDGDLDLFLGDRYFERRSTNLTDLVERTNPLSKYNGTVMQIVDFDGDGHVELIVDTLPTSNRHNYRSLAFLRRALDGSFVQSAENPFTEVEVSKSSRDQGEVYVADLNSDGLPDILVVATGLDSWPVSGYYEQVQNCDMEHNFHLNGFEDIGYYGAFSYPMVVDWNQDGVDDHVLVGGDLLRVRVYEIKGLDVQEIPPESNRSKEFDDIGCTAMHYCTFVDWDGDGDLDLLQTTHHGNLAYYERVHGRFVHGYSVINLISSGNSNVYTPVDWDQDGDMDMVSGDGRYYEQLADGSLKLWRQNIFTPFLGPTGKGQCWHAMNCALRFLDCDGDGDLDLLQVEWSEDPPVQVCEHDSLAGTLTCGHDFRCLGANLSNFRPSHFKQFGELLSLDLVNVSDGRLKFIAFHQDRFQAVLWTPGFCTSEGACHDKGFCGKKQLQCTCGPGHELGDCSQCQRGFHGVLGKLGQIRNCKACPAKNGKVCDGRGDCFDDAAAQALAAPTQGSAVAFMAAGNGSCRCYEAHFNGSDVDGRSTCAGGICPAGSEEQDGTCRPCDEGSFSLAGGPCTKCGSGKYSLAASSSCLECEPGKVSETSGASKCDACPAGKYEIDHQSCSNCPAGFISSRGNSSCTKCPAGFIAPTTGSSTCAQCPGGTFAPPGSSECQKCLRGTYSLSGSGRCLHCLAGTVSMVDGASTCHLCPPGTEESKRQSCSPCRSGFISSGGNSSCMKCQAGFNAPKTGSSACEPCPGGFYSEEGAPTCIQCPVGTISGAASGSCDSCEGNFLRAVPDATKQSCEVDSIQMLLLAASALASTGFCFLCLTGFLGNATIADVSAQGQKVVMTTTLSHFLLKRSQVTFTGTGNPNLEGQSWTVQALNSFQLTLQVEGSDLDQLDTSMGRLHIKCPGPFIHTGLWRCPLIFWCLLFGAASACAMSQLTWFLRLLMASFGVFAGSLAFTWRFRQGQRTPLSKRRRQFLKEWPLPRQPCERGPKRSMTAGQLQDFVQFFEAFIKERSMYYVCSNIVKPLTKPFQLSFVELVGPTAMEWFVSHYWGMAVRHFNDAIRKHAMSYASEASEWRGLAYWICTFSNSQWKVKDELGIGGWQESSFYLALKSPLCKGTAMVIDEQVLPLQRIWCLFEVYHTILLSQNDHFQGLLLCASTGVLQEGRAGTDVAVRVAQRARDLDTRSAGASNERDLQMIHALIEQMPGGFDAMNDFVRETICCALEASHDHYEQTFRGLIGDLTPLPTLLPRQTMPSSGRNAGFVSLKGQVDPTEDVYPLP